MNHNVINHHLKKAEQSWDDLSRTLKAARDEIDFLKREHKKYNTEMKISDIARYLGVTRRTVYNMLDDGRLGSRKMIDVINFTNY